MRHDFRHRTASDAVAISASLLAGIGIGAAAMYLFDPNRGKVRRTRIQQQVASRARQGAGEISAHIEDALNRAQGLKARLEALAHETQPVDDAVVADRVRSHMGHVVEHAHAIHSTVRDGVVILRGLISDQERERLSEALLDVPGVRAIRDLMTDAAAGPEKEEVTT